MTASWSLFFELSRATTRRHNKFHFFLLTQRACRDFALCNSVHDVNMCSRMVPFVIRLHHNGNLTNRFRVLHASGMCFFSFSILVFTAGCPDVVGSSMSSTLSGTSWDSTH